MFDNDIFSVLDEWLDLDSSLQEDNADNLSADKNYTSSGNLKQSTAVEESQYPDEDNNFRETEDYTVWDLAFDENCHPSEFDGWGNPIAEAEHWQQQQGDNSCAVVAQAGVLESITGVDITEAEACEIAEANGWFDPETGTTPENIGKFLEHYGVACEKSYNANLEEIADALSKGDKVIVGLDANEIWYPVRDPMTGSPVEQTNGGHAVWVTGINTEPDGSVKIILNDSGTPDGQMKVVDALDFLNAWEDYDNLLLVADTPE